MEVKPGYKQTEVGAIPEEWKVKLLPEVCRFRGGKAHEQHISEVGRFVCVNSKFISTDGKVRKYSTANFCCAKQNDVLMVMSDLPSGRALAKAYLVEQDDLYAVNQRVCALTAYRDCPKYLLYILNRNPYFLKFDDGVNQTHLLNNVFRNCPLPIPPKVAEQEAIAGALSDVDELIGALTQLIAKKRDLKQAAMQQLLTGKKRLSGFSGQWKVKSMGECLRSRPDYGINAAAVPYSARLPVYIRITDISDDGRFLPEKLVSVGLANADQYYLSEGDLVFARTGASVGKSYLYKQQDGPLVFAGFLIRVRPDPDLLKASYLSAYVNTNAYWDWVRLMSMRSGQPGINGNEYAQLSLTLPPVTEQTAIAEVLSDMDAEIAALEQRRDKTRDLKQGMLQELLTGRTRLV